MDVRRTACALALPAFPVILLASSLASPTDSTANAVQLRAAAAHGPAWVAAALLELLAAAVLPFAAAGVVHAVRGRGTRLATTGAVLGVLGTLGMASIALRHMFIYGLAGIGEGEAVHALDRVDKVFGLVVLPLMFAGPLTFIALSLAAVRSGLAGRWVPLGAFLFFVSDMLPIPAAEEIQMAVGVVTFAVLAISSNRPSPRPGSPAVPASPAHAS